MGRRVGGWGDRSPSVDKEREKKGVSVYTIIYISHCEVTPINVLFKETDKQEISSSSWHADAAVKDPLLINFLLLVKAS